jgi:hypothetical protein
MTRSASESPTGEIGPAADLRTPSTRQVNKLSPAHAYSVGAAGSILACFAGSSVTVSSGRRM